MQWNYINQYLHWIHITCIQHFIINISLFFFICYFFSHFIINISLSYLHAPIAIKRLALIFLLLLYLMYFYTCMRPIRHQARCNYFYLYLFFYNFLIFIPACAQHAIKRAAGITRSRQARAVRDGLERYVCCAACKYKFFKKLKLKNCLLCKSHYAAVTFENLYQILKSQCPSKFVM